MLVLLGGELNRKCHGEMLVLRMANFMGKCWFYGKESWKLEICLMGRFENDVNVDGNSWEFSEKVWALCARHLAARRSLPRFSLKAAASLNWISPSSYHW